jgi:IS1 family transposase
VIASNDERQYCIASIAEGPIWYAIDPYIGTVRVSIFDRWQNTAFLKLSEVLEPLSIRRYCPGGWGAYKRHVEADQPTVGKENTPKIGRKPINLPTWIKR